jgi:hypothetical protein
MDRRAFATSWAKVSLADGRDNAIQSARGAGVSKSLKPVLTTSAPGKTPVSYSPLEGYCKDQNTVGVFSYNIIILPKFMSFEHEFSPSTCDALLHEYAQRIVRVLAKRSPALVTKGSVKTERLGLERAGFKLE